MYPWVACWYAYTLQITGRDEESRRLWDGFCSRWPDNELISWGAIWAAIDYGDWAWFDDLVPEAQSRGFDSQSMRLSISSGRQLRTRDAGAISRLLSQARDRLS